MFILLVLVNWRLGVLISEQRGPYDIFEKLRKVTNNLKFIDLSCFDCISLWTSLPLAFIIRSDWYVLVYWFAIAGASSLIFKVYERLEL